MRSLLSIFLLSAAVASAAITATARGTGGNNSTSTTLAVVPTSNIAAGSTGIVVIALDNSGSAGSALVAPATATDNNGHTWIRRQNNLYDNGAASAGAEIAFYTATLSNGLTTSHTLTITWTTTTVAKAWALWEAAPAAGYRVVYSDGAIGTGATDGTPTITTTSLATGTLVVGGGAVEASSGAWTGDADTSNGSWSAQQTAGFGTTTGGMVVTSQTKVVTGTATQTYNPTLSSADRIIGWISLTEVINPMVRFMTFFQ